MKTHGFTSASRIREKGGFNQVFAKPLFSKRTQYFSVLAGKGARPQARLGIVVGKRNVKLAVDRNKLKRVVRESFRVNQQHLDGLDIVVVIKKNFLLELQPVDLSYVFKVVGDKHLNAAKAISINNSNL